MGNVGLKAAPEERFARYKGDQADRTLVGAALAGNVREVERLIGEGGDVNDADANGLAALHAVSWSGHADLVRLLVERGSDLGKADADGRTALHHAVEGGRLEAAEVLIQGGSAVDAVEGDGETPLHVVGRNGRRDVADLLLGHGADVAIKERVGSNTALHHAASWGHEGVVRSLMRAKSDLNARAKHGQTSLHLAAANGHVGVVKALLEGGARRDVTNNDGLTALHLAGMYGRSEVVECLVEQGADLKMRDKNGCTALHLTAAFRHRDLMKFLLKASEAQRQRDRSGEEDGGAKPRMVLLREDNFPMVDYRHERWLGGGSFGNVYMYSLKNQQDSTLGKHRNIAVKVFKNCTTSEAEFSGEMDSLRVLRHGNIVSFLGKATVRSNRLLVMELCVPDLRELLHCPSRSLTEDEVSVLMAQIIDATAFMHKQGVIHRDLKPSNILFKLLSCKAPEWATLDVMTTPVKVGDFGSSRFLPKEGEKRMMSENVGTKRYQAPEVKEAGGQYGVSADIYSIGVIAFELLMNMTGVFLSEIPVSEILHKSGMSRHARDFVESCLDRDKDTRSSAEILLGHDFIHKHVGKIREVDSGSGEVEWEDSTVAKEEWLNSDQDGYFNILSFEGGETSGILDLLALQDVMNLATLMIQQPARVLEIYKLLNYLKDTPLLEKQLGVKIKKGASDIMKERLRELMDSVDNPVHPTEVFDLIVGTSLGSVFAFALTHGRNGSPMSVRDIIEMFRKEGNCMFRRDKTGPSGDTDTVRWSQDGLCEFLTKLFDQDATLEDFQDTDCAAAAVIARDCDPGSGNDFEILDTINPAEGINMVEILKAATCYPAHFDYPVEVNGKTYVDGGTGENSSLEQAIPLMQQVHTDRKMGCALSISPPNRSIKERLTEYQEHSFFYDLIGQFPDIFIEETRSFGHKEKGKIAKVALTSTKATPLCQQDIVEVIREGKDQLELHMDDIVRAAAVVSMVHRGSAKSLEHIDLILAISKQTMEAKEHETALDMTEKVLVAIGTQRGKDCVKNTFLEELFMRATKFLASIHFEQGDFIRAVRAHKLSMLTAREFYGKDANHEDTAACMNALGSCYLEMGDNQEAVKWYEQTLKMERAIHGEDADHQHVANVMSNLAIVYREMGHLQEAIKWQEQGLAKSRAILGEDAIHPDIAASMNNLGNCYGATGDYAEAVKWHERSLEMRKAIQGEKGINHPGSIPALNNLGICYHKMRRYQEAVKWYGESLKELKALYGENRDHPDIATALNNLGKTYCALGDYPKAINFLERSLNMSRAIHGEDSNHSTIAASMNNLGLCHHETGEYQEAVGWYEQSLNMQRAIRGEDANDPGIACIANNLGNCYSEMGLFLEGIKWHKKSLETEMAIHGREANNPDIAVSLNNLGRCYLDLGLFMEAARWLDHSLHMQKAIYGQNSNHLSIAASLNALGICYSQMQDYDEAIRYQEQSLSMRKAVYGQDTVHPDIAASLHDLAICCLHAGRCQEAIKWQEQSLKMRVVIHGENVNHPDIAASMNTLGNCHKALGEYEEAVMWLEKSLNMKRAIHGEDSDNPSIAASMVNLGLCYLEMGDFNEAADWHERALVKQRMAYGENTDHPDMATCMSNLGLCHQHAGATQEAIKWHMQSLAMRRAIHPSHPDILETMKHLAICYKDLNEYERANEWYTACLEEARQQLTTDREDSSQQS